jgi:hypothetical protein
MQSYPNAVRRFGLAALEARGPAAMPPRRAYSARPQRPAHRTVVRLWLPVTAIFWILSPAPLLLAPLGWFAPPRYRPANPYVAVFAIGRLLTSLGGTLVDVDTPDALVRIRLF